MLKIAIFGKPIVEFTGPELKKHCRSFFENGMNKFLEFSTKGHQLESFHGIEVRIPYSIEAAERLLSTWKRELIARASSENNGGLDAEIRLPDPDDGSGYPDSIDDPHRMPWVNLERQGFIEEHMELFDAIMKPVDFDMIAKAIKDQAGSLVDLGMKSAARDLTSFLNLMPRGSNPVMKTAGLEFSKYGGGSHEGMDRYYLIRDMEEALSALGVAEHETGVDGLCDAVSRITRELNAYGMIRDIPSRTKMGIPGILTATVYKDKTKFVLARDHADARLSFIALHGDIELPELVA